MVIPEPREHLRQMVADRMSDWLAEQGVGEPFPEGELADAVLELFPDLRVEDSLITEGWTVPGCLVEKVTHRQYVLRTAPEPLAEPVPVEETP